jgi:4-hydroxy 2-oxovalerate aldolase
MIKVLDCTLRDGGYVNDWAFGDNNIHFIIDNLGKSNIDIIECGFLSNKGKNNSSLFYDPYLKIEKHSSQHVLMINCGDYDCVNLPNQDITSIDGIRVAFHKKDIDKAFQDCEIIKQRGYKVFLQPMVSVSYTDIEFIDLIQRANNLNPYAFYIVDSFGVMKKNDLMRLYYLIDHNLKQSIHVGYHAHNNLQLAYSNAQAFVSIRTSRTLICDSSVYGMGRGAGNLNTELFIDYLNEKFGKDYNNEYIIKIIDEILNDIYKVTPWGYSLSYYLSAVNKCHPNYATYLSDKNTLNADDISRILSTILDSKKNNYDALYIESLYTNYQSQVLTVHSDVINKIKDLLKKPVLLLFPGSSIETEIDKLQDLYKYTVIAINFYSEKFKIDYVFVSNKRRYNELQKHTPLIPIISTSNIKSSNSMYEIPYNILLNTNEKVKDNAGLMCIKLLINAQIEEVYVAGFDGYSFTDESDFAFNDEYMQNNAHNINATNQALNSVVKEFSRDIKIKSITSERYIKID